MKLSFQLGSIPVRVHQSFFLVVAMLGYTNSAVAWVQWVIVAFIGVLLHELGHALTGRMFGLTPQIDLIGFGGLTSWSAGDARALGPGKRIAISFAGPFTGLVIGGATLMAVRTNALPSSALAFDVIWVNAGWGAMNLLPILPMDGGSILFQAMNAFTKGHGEKPARIVSLVVAGALGIFLFAVGQLYGAILAALFTFQNFQALRAAIAQERGDVPPNEPPQRF